MEMDDRDEKLLAALVAIATEDPHSPSYAGQRHRPGVA
jgi:hypothetical protein